MRIEAIDAVRVVHLGGGPNMFDGEWVPSFHSALDEVEADTRAEVVVTIGDGKAYTTGFDVEYLTEVGDDLSHFLNETFRALSRVLTFPMPTVAALNGHAFGVGAILAVAHDQRVMNADRGWFCLPEADLKMRFHPFLQALLTSKLPTGTLLDVLLTGHRYDDTAAADVSIVDAATDRDELIATAIDISAERRGKDRDIVHHLKADLFGPVLATLG